jgi:hypothetical protein
MTVPWSKSGGGRDRSHARGPMHELCLPGNSTRHSERRRATVGPVEPELMSDGADRRPCTGWCVDHSLRRRYLRRNQEPTARVDPTLSVTSYRSSRTGEADDFRRIQVPTQGYRSQGGHRLTSRSCGPSCTASCRGSTWSTTRSAISEASRILGWRVCSPGDEHPSCAGNGSRGSGDLGLWRDHVPEVHAGSRSGDGSGLR